MLLGLLIAGLCSRGAAFGEDEPPVDWVDAKTGHRVVRLSREPGSASLYFHQYPYSADGRKLIFTTPGGGIATVNLETREIDQVVEEGVFCLLTGRKTGDVYYARWQRRDGGGPASVANRDANGDTLDSPGNGQWIYLFRPELTEMTGLPGESKKLVKTGRFRSERLVDMSNHDYDLEPNVTSTPDAKWIVFRSNMDGPTHVYAVEIAKAE